MKYINQILSLMLTLPLALSVGCAGRRTVNESSVTTDNSVTVTEMSGSSVEETTSVTQTSVTGSGESKSNILVVYFSRTGEQYNVGVIDKGNTEIVAEAIAERTGADLFEVIPEEDHYPMTYDELAEVAKNEQNSNARPQYKGSIPDLSKYDKIFIGAPVWWGDWPMIMYTFFENNSDALSGKTLIPFSTHEGSGLSGFDKELSSAFSDSEVLEGLAVRGSDCQNKPDDVRARVNEWVSELGY